LFRALFVARSGENELSLVTFFTAKCEAKHRADGSFWGTMKPRVSGVDSLSRPLFDEKQSCGTAEAMRGYETQVE